MTWDVISAAKRIGLMDGDTSRDADLQAALDASLAAAESYCDRRFPKKADTQDVRTWPASRELLVRRWPIESLTGLQQLPPLADPPPDLAAIPASWRVNAKLGMVYLYGSPGGGLQACTGFTLSYVGGFDPLPADLEAALWMIFDGFWSTTPGWGAEAGSQSGGGGVVRSFAIDGASISYDSATSAGSSGAGDAAAWGVIPARAVGILDFYRAESAALGG